MPIIDKEKCRPSFLAIPACFSSPEVFLWNSPFWMFLNTWSLMDCHVIVCIGWPDAAVVPSDNFHRAWSAQNQCESFPISSFLQEARMAWWAGWEPPAPVYFFFFFNLANIVILLPASKLLTGNAVLLT